MAPIFDITPERQAGELHHLYSQIIESKPRGLTRKDENLSGQTAIVTGGNTGIGLETSRILLDLGLSKLIIGVRNEERGKEASKTLLPGRIGTPQTVEVWKLDMAEYASVTDFAKRVAALHTPPDVIVLNAGVLRVSPTLNPFTDHDEDVQTNPLSTVLLLVLLLRTLKTKSPAALSASSAPTVPRVSVITSNLAHQSKFMERNADPLLTAFDAKDQPNWDFKDRYGTSKLLTLLFLSELVKRIPSDLAIINAPTPGLCRGTGLPRDAAGTMFGFVFGIYMRIVGHSCLQGARNFIIALLKGGPDLYGQYVENGKLRPLPTIAYTPEGEKISKKLWKETMQELSFAGVEQIIQELGSSS